MLEQSLARTRPLDHEAVSQTGALPALPPPSLCHLYFEFPREALLGQTEQKQNPGDPGRPGLGQAAQAWREILFNLCFDGIDRRSCFSYFKEIDREARKNHQMAGSDFVAAGLAELACHGHLLRHDRHGQLINPAEVGSHFLALHKFLKRHVEIRILSTPQQLASPQLPLAKSFREKMAGVLSHGESLMLLMVKVPPEEAARQLQEFSNSRLRGLMFFWKDRQFLKQAPLPEALRDYLLQSTVRVLCTGTNAGANQQTLAINQQIEKIGGFEDSHWTRMVRSVALVQKQESLKHALGMCIPILALVKAVESFAPGALHAVGGVLDDLFGAIIPNVSQSMGSRDRPWRERFKNAWPVLREGLASLPIAAGLGWGASLVFGVAHHPVLLAGAGLMFAFACCGGTLGTSIGAVRQSWRALSEVEKDGELALFLGRLTAWKKLKLAVHESILDVPFRVGHTLLGVPLQMGLGMAAGIFGFFHNPLFVMVEGTLETVLGAVTAAVYPWVSKIHNRSILRRCQPD